MNKVILIGRLGKDPELRYTQQGMPVCNFRIATDESYTDKDGNRVDKAEWHSIVCFQRPAENCAKYLAKGSQVAVEGSLQTRKWQDQQGQDRYTTEIKASRVQFLSRSQNQNGQPQDAGDGQYYDDGYDQGQGGYQGGSANGGQRSNGNGQRSNGNGQRGNQSRPQGSAGGGQRGNANYGNGQYDDLGPAFPNTASGMDDVPF